MSDYLFALTISPVQEFISQAKKSKDLFGGSKLLSDIIGKLKKEISKDYEIIYPQSDKYVSNKIVFKISANEEQINKLGDKLEEFVNNQFINEIFKNFKFYKDSLRNFFNVYWVAIKCNGDYKETYNELEKKLFAIKNFRKNNKNFQNEDKKNV